MGGVGQIICGTVEQGTLLPGDVIGIVPSGLRDKKIFSIEQHKKTLDKASPGDSVGLSIKGISKDEKVNPGDIIYVQKDGDLKPIKSFTCIVAVQEHPGVLKPGYAPVIFCRTAKVACKMTKILWKMGKKTGGLLLVPAEKGGFEAAIAKADAKLGVEEGQTRQHARLLFLLGVDQLIVGVNKMDSCGWDESRFNEIKEEFQKMLQMIGFKVKKIPFIPYSGFNGDNLVDKTDKAPWYKGWSANINPSTRMLRLSLSRASLFSWSPLRRVQPSDVLLSWTQTD